MTNAGMMPILYRQEKNESPILNSYQGVTTMPKLKDLKNEAFKLALKLGLTCTTTKQLKKRGLTKGLDMRRKDAWVSLLNRLKALRFGVVVPHLLAA